MTNIGNPFVECTSRDMSYKEVSQFWCDPFSCYPIDYSTLITSMTPIFIEGPRGSGKTMILKYMSYFCQKELLLSTPKNGTMAKMIDKIKGQGSVGIYFRYKDDFDSLFQSMRCPESAKEQIFRRYFELYILYELVQVLLDLEKEGSIQQEEALPMISQFNTLLNINVESIEQLSAEIANVIWNTDQIVKRMRYSKDISHIITESSNGAFLLKRACSYVTNSLPKLSDVVFLFIIDEYENAGRYQRIINTLIKQVDHTSHFSFRVGFRPNGISTLSTTVGAECLEVGRDYLLFRTQQEKMKDYKAFIEQVANRRLDAVDFFHKHNISDIKLLLGKRENLDNEARMIVRGEKKHFRQLNRRFSGDELSEIIRDIENPDDPLMEMLNIVWILRGKQSKVVKIAMDGYRNKLYTRSDLTEEVKLAKKYKLDYADKYRMQLLSVLIGIYSSSKMYYSFNTFAYLSSGSVNDFISLCRNVFYLLDEDYYNNCKDNCEIDAKIQTHGVLRTAMEQIEKIRLNNEHGLEMFSFTMNMGVLFRELSRDVEAKYPETNQFAFSDENDIEKDENLKSVKDSLIKWGIIIKKRRFQSISIGRRKGTIYHLNHIYSPIFNISYRTRGGYNYIVSPQLFANLIRQSMEASDILSWKDNSNFRVQNSNEKNTISSGVELDQLSLFDD